MDDTITFTDGQTRDDGAVAGETRAQRRARYQRLQDEAFDEYLYWQRKLYALDAEDIDESEQAT